MRAALLNARFDLLENPCGGSGCPADLDGNGQVGSTDIAILLSMGGSSEAEADLDGNGTVAASDIAQLLVSWGACEPPADLPECYDGGIDPPSGCGVAGTGSCCSGHINAGCDDAACCELICGIDPSCCEHFWDGHCVMYAHFLCDTCK